MKDKIITAVLFVVIFSVAFIVKIIIKSGINEISYWTNNEKVVKDISVDLPLPKNKIYGMKRVVDNNDLSVEFFDDVNLNNNAGSVLCDYIDSDYKNELRVSTIHLTKEQANESQTFNNIPVSVYQDYVKQIKDMVQNQNSKVYMKGIKYIDE